MWMNSKESQISYFLWLSHLAAKAINTNVHCIKCIHLTRICFKRLQHKIYHTPKIIPHTLYRPEGQNMFLETSNCGKQTQVYHSLPYFYPKRFKKWAWICPIKGTQSNTFLWIQTSEMYHFIQTLLIKLISSTCNIFLRHRYSSI